MSTLRRMWLALYAHYRDYHAYGPPRLKYTGYVGVLTVVLFYFIRFSRPNAPLFDDFGLRLTAFVMMLLLALKEFWPEKLKRYYIGYSYLVLLYTLPCFTVLVALQRGGGLPAISNAFIALCFLVLLTDWRNTLVMLTVGSSLAAAFYIAVTPDPHVPMDLVAQLPAFALIVLGGNLFKFSTEQIDAERKLRATQALAGSIAHEMRNPLSRIRHSLERMQQALPVPSMGAQPQEIGAAQADELYRHLADSEVAVKRGLQVIAMTLDEVSAKPIDTSAFSLLSAAEVTLKAVEEFAFESPEQEAKVAVRVPGDFSFRGDETAFLFVIFNLLKNALYYLPARPGALVTITVGDHAVKVHDTGPGIEPDLLARLFQPFASSGKAGGTGLGLAYCRRVMRAFGGDIECESVPQAYTEFTLRFPPVSVQEAQRQEQQVLERARAVFRGRRVLVVDDDAAQRITTRHKLQALDAVVDQAADGARAMESLARERYDLLLLDLKMPVLDGFSVAERVREGRVPLNKDLTIVAYTSEPAHLAALKTRKAGMDGFASKPCAPQQLLQLLLEAHERASWRRTQHGLAGRRIIVADDSPQNRKAVVAYLRHAGAEVVEASHGAEVLQLVQGSRFDAVLTDLHMPGIDGLQTARAIRALPPPACSLPIIALTAHSDDATVKAAQEAGMTDFITKPVEAPVLYRMLGDCVPARVAAAPLQPTLSAVAAGPADRLLNVERLESLRRIGMLDELLGDYLPEICTLVERLRHGWGVQDFEGCMDALHSLLGMSGEAGAQALYQAVRRVYVPMRESGAWPPQGGWCGQIATLAADTDKALRAYGAAQRAVDPS